MAELTTIEQLEKDIALQREAVAAKEEELLTEAADLADVSGEDDDETLLELAREYGSELLTLGLLERRLERAKGRTGGGK